MDLALNIDGDLDVASGSVKFLTGLDALVQSVKIRLKFYAGEWFLDPTAGVPYFQDVLVKNPDASVLSSIFRTALLETPGITSVDSLSLSIDGATRKLTVSFRVTGDLGVIQDAVTL